MNKKIFKNKLKKYEIFIYFKQYINDLKKVNKKIDEYKYAEIEKSVYDNTSIKEFRNMIDYFDN